MADLDPVQAFVASAKELLSYRCTADKFTKRVLISTVERNQNRIEVTKMEYDMNLDRDKSVKSRNGLSWVSNPDLAALPGLTFETLARVDHALEFMVDVRHGIDRGINPTMLCVVTIPRHSKGIGTCASDILVKICHHG